MIEVQIKERELYDKLKQYAEYYSDITQVVSVPDSCRDMLPEEYAVSSSSVNDKPVLSFEKGKIRISPVTDGIRCYLNMFLSWGNEASLNDIDYIYKLINSGAVYVDGSFKAKFSKISRTARISELHTTKKKYKINGKMFSFDDDMLNLRMADLFDNVEEKPVDCYSREIRIVSVLKEADRNGRQRVSVLYQYEENGEIKDGSVMIYNNVENIARMLNSGKRMNALFDNNGNIKTFLPSGMEVNKDVVYSQSKESKKLAKIPVAIFRHMYYEYLVRR